MSQLTKSQKWLLIVLLIVLGFAAIDFFANQDEYLSFYSKKKQKSAKIADSETVMAARNEITRNSETKYAAGWGSDPFHDPQVRKAVPRPRPKSQIVRKISFNLKAISFSGDKSVAIIDDKIVMTGDRIEGYRVEKIEQGRVHLSNGKESITLTLK